MRFNQYFWVLVSKSRSAMYRSYFSASVSPSMSSSLTFGMAPALCHRISSHKQWFLKTYKNIYYTEPMWLYKSYGLVSLSKHIKTYILQGTDDYTNHMVCLVFCRERFVQRAATENDIERICDTYIFTCIGRYVSKHMFSSRAQPRFWSWGLFCWKSITLLWRNSICVWKSYKSDWRSRDFQ